MSHLHEAWRKLASIDYALNRLNEEEAEVVAMSGGQMVGELQLRLDPYEDRVWMVDGVTVDQAYQRQGIAIGMAQKFHQEFPGYFLGHLNFESQAGEAFATSLVRDFPSWNFIYQD